MSECVYNQIVEKWGIFEVSMPGKTQGNPFTDYTIQGTGVDILAFLNSNLNDKIEEYGYEELVKPYLFRHDEIDVAVHKNLFELLGEDGVNDFLTDTFEHQIDDWSPFKVEIARIEHTKDYNSILKDE